MTDVAPSGGSSAQAPSQARAPERKPRKAFLLVGIALAVILGIFLFTGLGTSQGSGSTGSAPRVGDPVPSFTSQNVGPSGGSSVSVSSSSASRGGGRPTVLLFFGNWCPSCHQELPPLAAAAQHQAVAGGQLARVRVVGVDSEDTLGNAKSFIHSSGVTFPVAYDPNVNITSGLFYFDGDPYAVFVRADGTIAQIVRGDVLTPSSLTADERALIPSGT